MENTTLQQRKAFNRKPDFVQDDGLAKNDSDQYLKTNFINQH